MSDYTRRAFLLGIAVAFEPQIKKEIERAKKRLEEEMRKRCEQLVFDEPIGPNHLKFYEGKFSRLCGKYPDRLQVFDATGKQLLREFEDYNSNGEIGDVHKDAYVVWKGGKSVRYSSEEVIDENGISYTAAGSASQKVLATARVKLKTEVTPEYRRLKGLITLQLAKRLKN